MQTLTAPFRLVLRLPQPFRTLFWLAMAAWVFSVVALAAGAEARWFLLPFPAVMVLAGLTLAVDLRGNASRMIELSKETGAVVFPLVLVRALGIGVAAVALLFIALIATGHS